ncbi:MAG: fibronectin type III domain-containing protein [Chloroflexi bacterium]|nr:fibronectin type III domain-containing protein [Chloroflexota bacterium]
MRGLIRRHGRLLRVTGAALGTLFLMSFAVVNYEALVAQEAGDGIRFIDLSEYPTHLTVDGFEVELTNLSSVVTYEVVVSSDSVRVGIGGCGTQSQTATVTGVAARKLSFAVYACAVGEATVTAEVRQAGGTGAEASVSRQLEVEALPEIVIGPKGERIRTTPQGAAGASGAVPKTGTPGIVPRSTIQFNDITATSVRVTWGQPSSGGLGKKLTGFGLKFWKDEIQEPSYESRYLDIVGPLPPNTPPNTPSEYIKTGLEPNKLYNFRIHACNGEDSCGYWTNPALQFQTPPMATPTPTPTPASTPGSPTEPHSILFESIRTTSFKVKWSPHVNTGGTALTGFGILVGKMRGNVPDWSASTTKWAGKSARAQDVTRLDDLKKETELKPGTTYVVKIKSCNGAGGRTSCGNWSVDSQVTTATSSSSSKLASPELVIRPLPYRGDRFGYRLEWDSVDNADTYLIGRFVRGQVRLFKSISSNSPTSLSFTLDEEMKPEHFGTSSLIYTATAVPSDGNFSPSNRSMITVAENPIARIKGGVRDSEDQLYAEVTWPMVVGATSYTIHYRELSGNHTDLDWVLESAYAPGSVANPWKSIDVTPPNLQRLRYTHKIGPLEPEKIYGVNLAYSSGSETFGSVREAYVWSSDSSLTNGDRVATFPLTNRRRGSAMVYRYRVCFNLFDEAVLPEDKPPETIDDIKLAWSALVDHALGQWETATDGVVKMIRRTDPCADYTGAINAIHNHPEVVKLGDGAIDKSRLLSVLEMLSTYADIEYSNLNVSEVIVIDFENPLVRKFEREAKYSNITSEVRVASCIFPEKDDPDDRACVRPLENYKIRGASLDILIAARDSYEGPGSVVAGVKDNTCLGQHMNRQEYYTKIVHEGGHVLGIGGGSDVPAGWNEGLVKQHSTVRESIMSYKSRDLRSDAPEHRLAPVPSCAPYPLDVMAIYALYYR